ncbi:MAG: DUF2520 domain-containing protein [Bacteroidales bacterium]|nr:DUF2520 domain-containing protein [Bacteroidales bacterium]MCF8334114.1 DUF2520 domain-containing protein [Bacteroidales bacterium]
MNKLDIKSIAICGSGNVATHLAQAFYQKGFNIESVYSRTNQNAVALANKVEARVPESLSELPEHSDLLILAVPDIAIKDVARQLPAKKPLTVHVSGSTAIDELEAFCENYGVLYPLQTFTKERILDYSEIPVCVEANDQENTHKLKELSQTFSNDVRLTNSRERLVIHLSAVYASNFVNYMNLIASDLLARENISRNILFPLIRETMNKLMENNPAEVQTGPAVRGDHGTLHKHVEVLSTDIENQKIYRILSEEIQKYFKH